MRVHALPVPVVSGQGLPDIGTRLINAAERAQEQARAEGSERAAGHFDGPRKAVGMLVEHAHRYGFGKGAFGVDSIQDLEGDPDVERPTGRFAG